MKPLPQVKDDAHQSMETARKQRTIGRPAAVAGFGYWSGRDVRLEFRPADPSAGIVFVRRDLEGCPRIPAGIRYRVEIARRSTLQCDGAGVEMVEHALAALAGLSIDNCEIRLDAAELPGLDGSAQPFVEVLDAAGIVEQNAWRPRRVVRETIRLGDERSWIEARPLTSPAPVLSYELDYGPQSPIGRQALHVVLTPQSFRAELAASRTFLLKSEADALRAQGIGRRATARDLLVFGDDGPIDNRQRFPDECVRHKLADMVGDLALAGCDLVGQFHACRSGHRLNAELVRALVPPGEQSVLNWRRCA